MQATSVSGLLLRFSQRRLTWRFSATASAFGYKPFILCNIVDQADSFRRRNKWYSAAALDKMFGTVLTSAEISCCHDLGRCGCLGNLKGRAQGGKRANVSIVLVEFGRSCAQPGQQAQATACQAIATQHCRS